MTGVGDLLGFPRGLLVNFVLRHVRKQVPPWSMPGALRFKSALAAGTRTEARSGAGRTGRTSAFLQYTGGTTGVAKAAVLTHRNMVANLLQSSAWIAPAMASQDAPRRDHGAAALSHLFADRELPPVRATSARTTS